MAVSAPAVALYQQQVGADAREPNATTDKRKANDATERPAAPPQDSKGISSWPPVATRPVHPAAARRNGMKRNGGRRLRRNGRELACVAPRK